VRPRHPAKAGRNRLKPPRQVSGGSCPSQLGRPNRAAERAAQSVKFN
jgi:hypothetical protein